ncbi:hypothetical protein [Sideroxyarcus emersonii]|uniref:hypothetical protein n=1 Tax=Sideroxyarcus emersonii TaxID=2764705 RepID=UPI001F1E3793|nr:hypothetical protein [Sideroxyarcus emersonii]
MRDDYHISTVPFFYSDECSSTDSVQTGCQRKPRQITGRYFVVMCPSKESGVLTSCSQAEANALTVEDFVATWGKPKEHGEKFGLEYISYNNSIAWRGFFGIFIIIPLPLIAPVGRNETILFFKDGRLIRTMVEFGRWDSKFEPVPPR